MAQNVHLPPYPEPQPQPQSLPPLPGHQAPYPEQPQNPGFKQESNTSNTCTSAPEPHDAVFGIEPQCVRCPHCNLAVESKVEPEIGKVTWLSSLACVLFACVPCCWCPFCWNCTRDVKHTCPRCGRELGFHRRC